MMFNKQKIFAAPQDNLTDSQRITNAAILTLQNNGEIITLTNIEKVSGLPNSILEDVLSGFELSNRITRVAGEEPTYEVLTDEVEPADKTFYDWNKVHPKSAYTLSDIR